MFIEILSIDSRSSGGDLTYGCGAAGRLSNICVPSTYRTDPLVFSELIRRGPFRNRTCGLSRVPTKHGRIQDTYVSESRSVDDVFVIGSVLLFRSVGDMSSNLLKLLLVSWSSAV